MRKARISWSPELLSRITRSLPSQDCSTSGSHDSDSKQPFLQRTRDGDGVLLAGDSREHEDVGPASESSCLLISACVRDTGSSISGSRLTSCHFMAGALESCSRS